MFGYSFVDFWTTKYIRIFVCKFCISEYIRIFTQIHILIFAHLFFMNKVNLDKIHAQKSIQCKIVFRGRMSELFSKNSLISDEYEYLNIPIK